MAHVQKHCKGVCGRTLDASLENFSPDETRGDGLARCCKDCRSAAAVAARARTRERGRASTPRAHGEYVQEASPLRRAYYVERFVDGRPEIVREVR